MVEADDVVISCPRESAVREESCLDGVRRYFWKNSHGIDRHGSLGDEIVVNFSCEDLAVVLDGEVGYGRNGSCGNFMPWRKCGA